MSDEMMDDLKARAVRTESKLHTLMTMQETMSSTMFSHHRDLLYALAELQKQVSGLREEFKQFKTEWDAEGHDA